MPIVESRLVELGYSLPPPPEPIGNYLSASSSGNIMWMAGVGSRRADGSRISGKLGEDLTVEQGYEAAKRCGLSIISLQGLVPKSHDASRLPFSAALD